MLAACFFPPYMVHCKGKEALPVEQFFDFLLAMPLFAGLARDELARLLHCCGARIETLEDTSLIWWENHPQDVTYLTIVLEGQMRIFQEDWRGNRIMLGTMTKGLFFNDAVFYHIRERMPFICEIPSGSTFLVLDNAKLLRPCAKSCPFHWEFQRNMLIALLEQQAGMFMKIEYLSQRTTRAKIMALFSFIAAMERSRAFTLPMSRQELADELSVDRTGISKELSLMQKEGLIRYRRNRIELLD